MNKSSREKLNLFFSSFLVIGFVVCTYFFMSLATKVALPKANLIKVAVFALFGLIVFYATRVGEGVAVKRFSPIILCVLDIPALYIILATLVTKLPLHNALVAVPEMLLVAAVALGYGIPYTFLSGFELVEEPEQVKALDIEEIEEVEELLEGGLAQELADAMDEVASEEDVAELESLDGTEE